MGHSASGNFLLYCNRYIIESDDSIYSLQNIAAWRLSIHLRIDEFLGLSRARFDAAFEWLGMTTDAQSTTPA
jgi:hypothetical protein